MGFIEESQLDPAGASGGGSFVTEDMLDPVSHTWGDVFSELSSGKQQLTPELISQAQGAFGESLKQGIVSAADSVPFVDEGAAGARALIGKGQSMLGFTPSFQGYDAELEAIRGGQKQYAAENPIADLGNKLAAGVAMAPLLPSAAATTKGFWPTLRALALEGGTYGGLSGAGAGEGGQDRLEKAGEGIVLGAGANVLLGGAANALGKIASRGSDDTLKQALDVQRSELRKARKFLKDKNAPNPLMEAIRGADDRGVFSIGDDADTFIAKNQDHIEKFGDEVSTILSAGDNAPRTQSTIPTIDRARKVIQENPNQAEALTEQLKKRLNTLYSGFKDSQAGIDIAPWDGTLKGLNEFKRSLYRIGYKGTTESRELDQALGSDMRAYIENEATNLLGAGTGDEIAKLNRLQGQHLQIREQLDKIADKDNMSGGLGLAIRRAAISPLGGAAGGAVASYYTGDPSYIIKGAALGALGTRGGQLAVSRTLKPVGEALTGASGRAALPAISSIFQKSSKTEPSKPPSVFDKKESSVFALPKNKEEKASLKPVVLKTLESVEASPGRQTSPKGAQGVYQIMPEMQKRLGVKDPFDKAEAGDAAWRLWSEELDRFKDPKLAFAAYNLGSPKLKAVIDRVGSKNWKDIAPHVPKETRDYVARAEKALSELEA